MKCVRSLAQSLSVVMILVGLCDSSAFAQRNALWADFDGDRKSDLAVWRPSDGGWYVVPSSGSCPPEMSPFLWGCLKQWGLPGDTPVSGDYAGDGRNDFAVWRPSNKTFYIAYSYGGTFSMSFASYFSSAVRPSPGDYTRDGRTDIAFIYPHYINSTSGILRDDWIVRDSTTATVSTFVGTKGYRGTGSRPNVSADYNGDGRTDRATVIDQSQTDKWIYYGVGATVIPHTTNTRYAIWVAGDYTGDGKSDFAYWDDDVTGNWTIFRSGSVVPIVIQWGLPGDIPVTGDFDGDGVADPTVWRPSNGTFYVFPSSRVCPNTMSPYGAGCVRQWGLPGDIPVPRSSVW